MLADIALKDPAAFYLPTSAFVNFGGGRSRYDFDFGGDMPFGGGDAWRGERYDAAISLSGLVDLCADVCIDMCVDMCKHMGTDMIGADKALSDVGGVPTLASRDRARRPVRRMPRVAAAKSRAVTRCAVARIHMRAWVKCAAAWA